MCVYYIFVYFKSLQLRQSTTPICKNIQSLSLPLSLSLYFYFFFLGNPKKMDFIAHPSGFSASSSSSSSLCSLVGNFFDKVKEGFNFAVSAILGNIFSAIFTFFFALGKYPLFLYDLMICPFLFLKKKYNYNGLLLLLYEHMPLDLFSCPELSCIVIQAIKV